MTFTTYAQNCEDVLLWRALGHVKEGFYIDVGANDPVEHSVTRAFYDRGWHGISIEPLPAFHQALVAQRPRDINLAVAAGAAIGELTLYDVPAVRGWASPERQVADQHQAEGYQVAELTVPVRTLASVCEEHVQGEIHFLKIDVEGFEGEVLRGMDFKRWRPWILVIEATLPNSRVTNHDSWEHLVTSQDYRFVWFDGLNRWYVADEHAELRGAFGIQPNVFDDFVDYHLAEAWAEHKAVVKALRESEAHAAVARVEMHDAMQRAQYLEELLEDQRAELEALLESSQQTAVWARGLEEHLIAMQASTSWRITRPLRGAARVWRSVRRPGLLRRLLARVTSNQRIRSAIIPVLLRYPALGRRVSASLQAIKQAVPGPAPAGLAVPEELRALPASVRTVLADL
ncbi:MAG TPA: FkbM family methyltransferase, partial [Ramlibacter sp.]